MSIEPVQKVKVGDVATLSGQTQKLTVIFIDETLIPAAAWVDPEGDDARRFVALDKLTKV